MANDITIKLAIAGMADVDAALSRVKSGFASTISSISSSVRSATGTLAGLAGAGGLLSAGGALAGLGAGVKQIADLGGKLKDLSTQAGVGVQDIVLLRQALQDTGVNADDVGKLFGKLSATITNAKENGGEAAQEFQKLGLSVNALSTSSPADQFKAISAAISSLPTATERAAAAIKIFGKSGAELIPFFSDGGALTAAQNSLGRLPNLLAINAELLDAIGDSLGHIGIKSQQFFAGFVNIIGDDLLKIVQTIDQIDFSKAGEKLGAFVLLFKRSWADGKLSELVGLSIEAGFETASNAAKSIFKAVADFAGNLDLWKPISYAITAAMLEAGRGIQQLWGVVYKTMVDMVYGAVALQVAAIQSLVSFTASAVPGAAAVASNLVGKAAGVVNDVRKSGMDFISEQVRAGGEGIDALKAKAKELVGIKPIEMTFSGGAAERLGASIKGIVDQVNSLKPAPFVGGAATQTTELRQQFDLLGFQMSLKEQILSIDERIAEVGSSFTMTEAQKYGERRALLESEMSLLQERISIIAGAAAATEDLSEKNRLLAEQMRLQSALSGVRKQTVALGPNPDSFADQFQFEWKQSLDRIGTFAQQTARTVASVFDTALSSVGSNLSNIIRKTGDWRAGLMNIADSVMDSVIQGLVKMFAAWVTGLWAKSAATQATTAAETPGLGLVAFFTAIASSGWAVLAAIAAMGAGIAWAAGAFQEGGYTGNGGVSEPAGIVHRGEYVIPANRVSEIGVSALDQFRATGTLPVPQYQAVPTASQSISSAPASSSSGHPASPYYVVVVADGEAAAKRYLASKGGRGHITRMAQEQSLEVGNVG